MIDDYDNEDYDYFKEWDIEQYKQEIERLHSIIKEVREYIENMKTWDIEQEYDMKKLLEILDKVEE